MAEPAPPPPAVEAPAARVVNRRRVSPVWLIPFVAALIAGWLTYRALSERGPSITITFRTAEGLEAGKTRVKYRDLEIGVVEKLELSDDLSHVIVTAQMTTGTERFLSENTRFWVVRANVTAGGVTGLGTLLSGAYIAMDPVKGKERVWAFDGLESQPLVTSGDPGRRFVLRSPTLGSLQVGSPIYYRQVKVGEVVRADLDERGESVNIDIFIRTPHDERVRENTRFWNVSGVEVAFGAEGLKLNTESLVAMLIGGAAFETPDLEPGRQASEGTVFYLYPSQVEVSPVSTEKRQRYVLYFNGSVKGLAPGSPVEFRGIRVGQVSGINLEYDVDDQDFRIPVMIDIEPERLSWGAGSSANTDERMALLVERGLRARLKTANLLTGQLVVDLDMHPDAPPAELVAGELHAEIPTLPTPLEELSSSLTRLVSRLERLPLEGMASDLRTALAGVRETLDETRAFVAEARSDLLPGASKAVEDAQATIAAIRDLVGADSPVSRELKRVLLELGDAARSVRLLADQLEQNPESLLRGRRSE